MQTYFGPLGFQSQTFPLSFPACDSKIVVSWARSECAQVFSSRAFQGSQMVLALLMDASFPSYPTIFGHSDTSAC